MKNFLRKTLIYLILSVVAVPVSMYSGFATAPRAMATSAIGTYTFDAESDVPTAGNAVFSSFSRVGVTQSSAVGVFNSDHWATTAPVDRGKYISFTLVANSGYKISADSLKFSEKGSNTVANKFMVSYYLNGSTTPTDLAEGNVDNNSMNPESFALSVSQVDQIEFRFYVYGDTQADGVDTPTTSGTWRVDDVELDGSVTSLPPTVSLSDDQTDTIVKNGDVVNITATFDSVAGLSGTPTISLSPIGITNSPMTATADPKVWIYIWTVPGGNDGNVNVFISAVDLAGSPNEPATGRTSYTINNTLPTITLTGSSTISLQQYTSYTDAGATANDNIDGDLTGEIVTTGNVDTQTPGTYILRYNVSDAAGNQATEVTRTVTVTALDVKTFTDLDKTLVVTGTDSNGTLVNIPAGMTGSTLDLSAILVLGVSTNSATLPNNIVANLTTGTGTVQIMIPAGTTITGSASWNGILNFPEVVTNPVFTPATGETASATGTIEVGLVDTALTFDTAVRIFISGQAGQNIGYIRDGVFTVINNCSAGFTDDQISGNGLIAGGDCKLDSGSDLIIWTKHFTQFVTYSQTPTKPVITSVANIQENGKNYIDIAWNNTGADSYEIYIDEILASSNTVTSVKLQVISIGQHSVKVRAKVGSSYSDYSDSATVSVMALSPSTTSAGTVDLVSTTVSKSTSLVSTAQAAAPAATTPAEASDSDGIVKAAEAASSATTTTTNWTPWIVLFVLIILAGAATGGYFYWFAGKEELAVATNKDVKKVNSLSENTKEATVTVRDKPKSGNKKPNRW